jgi:hypothetical protein
MRAFQAERRSTNEEIEAMFALTSVTLTHACSHARVSRTKAA